MIKWNKNRNLPIYIFMTYFSLTLVSFWILFKNKSPNFYLVVLYCSASYLALILGLMVNWKTSESTAIEIQLVKKMVLFFSITNIIVSFVNVFTLYGSIQEISYFLLRPAEAYEYSKFIKRHGGANKLFNNRYVSLLLTSLNLSKYILFPFIINYWKSLNITSKIIGVVSILCYIIQTLLLGSMINVSSVFFVVLPIILKKSNKKRMLHLLISFFLMMLIITYFVGSRIVHINSGVISIFIEGGKQILFYISHGYEGLGYSFDLPFKWTKGSSFFRGIWILVGGAKSNTILYNNYLYRVQLEFGRSALQVWSTAFPWIASDMTFFLVPFYMFFVGYITKVTWKQFVCYDNPFALLLTGQMFLYLFMFPANNHLFHTYSSSVSFLFILFLYLISLRRTKVNV